MTKIIRLLSLKNWAYKFAIKLIANRIIHGKNSLTAEYLQEKGWIQEGEFWVESHVKDRDKIWVQFESNYYRVFHGHDKTFIALEDKLEWFENYYLLVAGNKELYKLANV